MMYSHNNHYSVGNHYEPLVKLKKLNRTVPWHSNLMKSNATNNHQGLPLDLSQSTQSATEADVPDKVLQKPMFLYKVLYNLMFLHQ